MRRHRRRTGAGTGRRQRRRCAGRDARRLSSGQDNGPGKRTGLQAFLENSTVSILAIPGVTAPEVQAALIGFCESRKSCFAILDVPIGVLKKTNDVANFRDMYDSSYAAMYHPWLEMFDAGAKRPAYFPPSGAMAGIYARSDNERRRT